MKTIIRLLLLSVFITFTVQYKYRYNDKTKQRKKKLQNKHKQFIKVGPFANLNQGFDPNAEKENNLLGTKMYRNLGPVAVGFNKPQKIKENDKNPYYDQDPNYNPEPQVIKTSIQEMKQNNVNQVENEIKMRINQKQPEPYYDPTEYGIKDILQQPSNVFVVPVDFKDDLRIRDQGHKKYKEQLKKLTYQQKQIEKAYYDPTLVNEQHFVDEQQNEIHKAFLAQAQQSQAIALEDYYQSNQKAQNFRNLFFNKNNLHPLSDYHQNHRQDQINKSRVLNFQLQSEKMPAIYEKSSHNYYKKRKLRKRRF